MCWELGRVWQSRVPFDSGNPAGANYRRFDSSHGYRPNAGVLLGSWGVPDDCTFVGTAAEIEDHYLYCMSFGDPEHDQRPRRL